MAEVDVDCTQGTAQFTMINRANFAQVVFRGVEDSYIVGTNIECRYTLSSNLEVTARDWVGLYRVGWRNQSDYIYYEWSPLPQSGANKESEITNCITFPASRLPKDDSEFYQFGYVTSAGHVRGASTPFQFKQQSGEELIEIEDENGELLIIKTKTAVLEDQLKKANETRVMLKQEILILQNEKDMMHRTEVELQKKVLRQKEMEDMTEAKMTEMLEMITDGNHQRDHLQDCIQSLQEKIEVINQEKQSMEKRLDDSDRYIGSLQEKIKTLVNDKDALSGRVKSLEEEKELYKGHYTTSENTMQSYAQECDRVRLLLIEEKMSAVRIKKEVDRMEVEMMDQRNRLEAQMKVSLADKENMDYLTERLRNAEDKLSAAEHCKMMLNEEVLALKQAYEKTSKDLESSKGSVHKLALQESSAYEKHQAQVEKLCENILDLEQQLRIKDEESVALSVEVSTLQGNLETKSASDKMAADGPLYALQMAQNTLKERYDRLVRKNEELRKLNDQTFCRMRELDDADNDQKQEISSLRDRLLMGQEAYKEKYIECNKLETQLHQLALERRNSSCSRKSTPVTMLNSGSVASSSGLPNSQIIQISANKVTAKVDEMSSAEVQQYIKDLGIELEKRYAKAKKYKRLYTEQKDNNGYLCQLVEKLQDYIKEESRSEPVTQKTVESHAGQKSAEHVKKSYTLKKSVEDFDAMTRSEEQSSLLVTPLKPLPAPIVPERLHSARAALNFIDDVGLNSVSHMIDSMKAPALASPSSEVQSVVSSSVATIVGTPTADSASAAYEEDRFEDAPGEPQQITCVCPLCETTFSAVEDLQKHVDAHYEDNAPICPLCNERFPDMSNDAFTNHVNSHFTDA